MRYAGIIKNDVAAGEGVCVTFFVQGCDLHCPGCHNPQTWDIHHGTMMTTAEIMARIEADPFADVTFSGGDPMFQAEGFAELAEAIKSKTQKTIWCYTGYLYENLLSDPQQLRLLKSIDVLVDGPFIQALKDPDLLFRGSSNQRLIDVPASLVEGEVVLLDYQPTKL